VITLGLLFGFVSVYILIVVVWFTVSRAKKLVGTLLLGDPKEIISMKTGLSSVLKFFFQILLFVITVKFISFNGRQTLMDMQ